LISRLEVADYSKEILFTLFDWWASEW
jgi:hypothetical protein